MMSKPALLLRDRSQAIYERDYGDDVPFCCLPMKFVLVIGMAIFLVMRLVSTKQGEVPES